MRTAYGFVLLPALVGVVLAAVAYFALNGNTGVSGTPGALLALIGAVSVTLGAFIAMMPRVRGWFLKLLNALLGLGALLTAAAAYFLMQYPFAVAMALAFLGLLAILVIRSSRRTA